MYTCSLRFAKIKKSRQINDPTYLLSKELTRILNPLDMGSKSFIQNSYHLMEMLDGTSFRGNGNLLSYDVVALYPNMPIKNTLELTLNKLKKTKP